MGIIIDIIFLLVLILLVLLNLLLRNITKESQNEPNGTNLSGFEIAKIISSKVAQEEPHIIKKSGVFQDYYDKNRNVIKLSERVFNDTSIYAGVTAIRVALTTDKNKPKLAESYSINSFIVIASYLMISIGAFLNNYNIIRFGFVLFILAFIIEMFIF